MQDYLLVKNFLDNDTINYYLEKSKNYTLSDSKVGNTVQKDKKRRKDIFFNKQDCEKMDDIMFTKGKDIISESFNVDIQFREAYKLGTYFGDDQGFYNPHTDTQGGDAMLYRKISLVICLSSENDYEGGLFKFIDLKKEFKFDKGDAIFFRSDLLHGVEPLTSGTRKVLISFLFDEDGAKIKLKYSPLMGYISKHTKTNLPLNVGPKNQPNNIPPNAIQLTPEMIVNLPPHIKNQLPPEIINHAMKVVQNNSFFNSNNMNQNNIFNFVNQNPQLQVTQHPSQISENNNFKANILTYSANENIDQHHSVSNFDELFAMDFHDKIISYSLWGNSELYNYGMMENAIEAKNIYPDYKLYVYYNNTCDEKIITLLKKMDNVVLIKVNDETSKATNMLWRFIPGFFSNGIVLIRDSDSIVNIREQTAVQEFLNSDKKFHIMRDNAGGHRYKILGGMWGCRDKILHSLQNTFKEMIKKEKINDIRGWDQVWLKENVYENIVATSFIHHNKGLEGWDQLESWSKEFTKTSYTYFVGGLNYFTPKTRELLGEKNDRLKRNPFYRYQDNNKYLLVIPPDSGPGNQIISIKESLIIAHYLKRKAIVPNICDHYIKDSNGNSFFKFKDIFKINLKDVELLDNLKLDPIKKAYSVNHGYYMKVLKHEKNLVYADDFNEELVNCRRFHEVEHFNELKQKDDKLLVLKHLFNNLCINECGFNGCSECIMNNHFIDVYKNICANLDYSDFIKEKANNYIKQHDLSDFIAIHIRYPDSMCGKSLMEWTNLYDEEVLYNMLKNMYGEDKKIFIATNNKNNVKSSLLGKFNIFDEDIPYASFIEQYICCLSDEFIMSIYNDFTKINQRHQRSTWGSFVQDYRMYLLNNYNNQYINDLV